MKVYLICGKARSGKTTVANILKKELELRNKKVMFCNFTKYLKYYAKDYFGWDGNEETKPRELLQHLGTDYIRNMMGKKRFFIIRTIEDIYIMSDFFHICIIHDVRYPLEIEEIKKTFDTVLIKVKRDNYDDGMSQKEASHEVEVALDSYDESNYDYIIYNKDMETLEEEVLKIIEKEV